jgi:drug/metabolite transporter (DMT)-like permease
MAEPKAAVGTGGTARGEAAMPPLALGLLLAVTLLWGANWPAMKVALQEIPPWTFRTMSLSASGLTLLALTRLVGDSIRIPEGRLWPLVRLAMVNVTGWHLGTAFGLLHIGSGRAAILGFTMPVWASLLAVPLLGERLSGRRLGALALGALTVLVLVAPELDRLGAEPLGAFLVLLASFSWALGTVLIKTVEWRMPVMALTGWQILIGLVPILLGWLLLEPWPDLGMVSPAAWAGFLYTTFVAMVFCFCAFIKIVTLVPAGVAAISTLAIPIVGLFSGALLLGEPVGLPEVIALLLVVLAMSLVLLPRRPAAG